MKRQTLLVLALVLLLCVDTLSTKANNPRKRLKCCSKRDLKLLEGKSETPTLLRLCKKCKNPKVYQPGGVPLPSK